MSKPRTDGDLEAIVGMRAGWLLRRTSATALTWLGAALLGAADILSAGLLPGPRSVLHGAAVTLATLAGGVFVLAVVRGLAGWRERRRPPAVAPTAPTLSDDLITREAEWGVAQIEAWLARQDQRHD